MTFPGQSHACGHFMATSNTGCSLARDMSQIRHLSTLLLRMLERNGDRNVFARDTCTPVQRKAHASTTETPPPPYVRGRAHAPSLRPLVSILT